MLSIDQSHCGDCRRVLWSGRTICPDCERRERDDYERREREREQRK